MTPPRRPLHEIDRCGNAPALDFVNTVHSRIPGSEEAAEYLEEYGDLLEWAELGELLTAAERRRLAREARAHPRRAAAVFRAALELREALYGLFAAGLRGAAPAAADLGTFNRWLSDTLGRRRIGCAGGRYALGWAPEDERALERPLWPVVESAAELLAQGLPERLRECPVPEGGCGWLFLDTSRGGQRRWCNMRTCGTLVKVRRHRARERRGRR